MQQVVLEVPEGRFVNFLRGKREKAVKMLEKETGATVVVDRSVETDALNGKATGLRKVTVRGAVLAVGLARKCITTRADKFRQGTAELEADQQGHGKGGGRPGVSGVTHRTTDGEVSTCSICASSPRAKRHGASSSGSRSEGVPEKPMRRPKSRSPPSSCPHAESFICWNSIVRGKTRSNR